MLQLSKISLLRASQSVILSYNLVPSTPSNTITGRQLCCLKASNFSKFVKLLVFPLIPT